MPTPIFNLPEMTTASESRHEIYNFSIQVLEAVSIGVIDLIPNPPTTPNESDAYIIDASATGAWTTHDNKIAVWINGGWELFSPVQGMRYAKRDLPRVVYHYNGTTWQTFYLGQFNSDQSWTPPQIADTTAVNDTVYYSTDATKLVYKDNSGTVNELY